MRQKINCDTILILIFSFRGAILSSCILPSFLGQMIAHGGTIFFYNTLVLWLVILLIVIAIGLFYFYCPDTPLWLIKNKKFEVIESSIEKTWGERLRA